MMTLSVLYAVLAICFAIISGFLLGLSVKHHIDKRATAGQLNIVNRGEEMYANFELSVSELLKNKYIFLEVKDLTIRDKKDAYNDKK